MRLLVSVHTCLDYVYAHVYVCVCVCMCVCVYGVMFMGQKPH